MATMELIVGALQQSNSPIISVRPNQFTVEFGRPYKRGPSPLQASAIAGRDDHGATLPKDGEQQSNRSSGPSLLKAVREGLGPHAVIQQVSSLGHVFVPDLPTVIIKEIRKRIPLISFREVAGKSDEEEKAELQNGSGAAVVAEEHEGEVTAMGPRCAWPRVKFASAEGVRPQWSVGQGPRCAWPRGSAADDVLVRRKAEMANSAKCAWPRAAGRVHFGHEEEMNGSVGSTNSGGHADKLSLTAVDGGESNGLSEGTGTMKDVSKMLNSVQCAPSAVEGPRCAWPRSTPRRMLATGVGLGLVNHLFITQGASALAILVETSLSFTEEDADSATKHEALLP